MKTTACQPSKHLPILLIGLVVFGWGESRWGYAQYASQGGVIAQADRTPRPSDLPQEPSVSPAIDGALLEPFPFVPRDDRNEATEDQIHASALFAEGRLLFRREQYDRALAKYERAYRYSNGSSTILDEIVPLAFRLGQLEEAVRYAKHATDLAKFDPFVAQRLALYLTEQEDFAAALKLYEIELPRNDDDVTVPTVITQFEIGRLLYLTDRFAEAVPRFDEVRKTLQQTDPPPAEKPAVDALLAERQVTYSLMAENDLSAGRAEQASTSFRLAYQEQPEAVILNFHLARVAALAKDDQLALERLDKYLQSGDTAAGTAPYQLLTELRGRQNEADQALAELETLAKQQDRNVFLLYFLAEQYLQRHDPAAAVRTFEQLIQVRPFVDGYRGLLRARVQQQDAAAIVRLFAESINQLGGLDALTGALDELVASPPLLRRVVETAQQDVLANGSPQPQPTQRAVALALAEVLALANDPQGADRYYGAAGRGETADAAIWLAWGMQRWPMIAPQRPRKCCKASWT